MNEEKIKEIDITAEKRYLGLKDDWVAILHRLWHIDENSTEKFPESFLKRYIPRLRKIVEK